MKRGLTILTAALFAGALALPAMAQSTDSGSNKEAPAASAVTNPGTIGAENAEPSADKGAVKADYNAAKVDNGEMKQEQKPADDSSAPQKKTDSNTTSDAGSKPSGATTAGHPDE